MSLNEVSAFLASCKSTENALKCLEIGKSEDFPLVFNPDKIKKLSEDRITKEPQTNSPASQTVRE